MTVGVLALQGDFAAHGRALDKLAVPWRPVRRPETLTDLSALVIPGGESSTLLKLMAPFDFSSAIHAFHQRGKTLFGTCAGLILLAHKVDPNQHALNLINISVKRNGYGRQLESFISNGHFAASHTAPPQSIEMVFIRAPTITAFGPEVTPVATYQQKIVAVRQDQVLGCAFHPEMSDDLTLYRYFISMIKNAA